jgi:hypothetical protein
LAFSGKYTSAYGPIAGAGLPGLMGVNGERWPSRLVATAATIPLN